MRNNLMSSEICNASDEKNWEQLPDYVNTINIVNS
jgi:hypothetical protein